MIFNGFIPGIIISDFARFSITFLTLLRGKYVMWTGLPPGEGKKYAEPWWTLYIENTFQKSIVVLSCR